jgi:hypothetical protein
MTTLPPSVDSGSLNAGAKTVADYLAEKLPSEVTLSLTPELEDIGLIEFRAFLASARYYVETIGPDGIVTIVGAARHPATLRFAYEIASEKIPQYRVQIRIAVEGRKRTP